MSSGSLSRSQAAGYASARGDPAWLHGAGPASPLAALPRLLAKLPDLERGITRILHRTANPAEFVTVVTSLSRIATQLGLQVSALFTVPVWNVRAKISSRPAPSAAHMGDEPCLHHFRQHCL